MNNNPLKKLEAFGQSIWLDYIRCDLNEVTKKLEDDGVKKFIASYDQLMKVLIKKSSVRL